MQRNVRKTTDEFIQDARRVHGNKYEYSEVRYVTALTCVDITCVAHGPFRQRPNDHLSGKGCRRCAFERIRVATTNTVTEFIIAAKQVHGERYDYDAVIYNGNKRKVMIKCHLHGLFSQTPDTHLDGSGCSECGRRKQGGVYNTTSFEQMPRRTKPGVLYVVELFDGYETCLKVGITTRTIEQRYSGNKSAGYAVRPLLTAKGTIYDVWQLEKEIQRTHSDHAYTPKHAFEGHTECFKPTALLDICEHVDNWIDEHAQTTH
jgi:hypothetical protein